MRFLKATFLIRLNRVVVKGQKTLENKEGDSSPSQTLRRPFADPSQTLRRPFADPSHKLRASAQGFGSGLRLRVRMPVRRRFFAFGSE